MKRINFGRAQDNDIVLDDKSVTRDHGYLLVDGAKVYVIDDGSTNGTYVNGRRIRSKALLRPGDRVMLAKKIPLDWQKYVGIDSDETILNNDETTRLGSSIYDSSPQPVQQPLVNIPNQMEINQNHAEVYRNGSEGADWKVLFKRNMGDRIGNAVGQTLGCIISIIIIAAFFAIVASLAS